MSSEGNFKWYSDAGSVILVMRHPPPMIINVEVRGNGRRRVPGT